MSLQRILAALCIRCVHGIPSTWKGGAHLQALRSHPARPAPPRAPGRTGRSQPRTRPARPRGHPAAAARLRCWAAWRPPCWPVSMKGALVLGRRRSLRWCRVSHAVRGQAGGEFLALSELKALVWYHHCSLPTPQGVPRHDHAVSSCKLDRLLREVASGERMEY